MLVGPKSRKQQCKDCARRREERREAGRLRGLAYPFGLGAHGRVVGVVGRSIGKVDLNVIRHFFQEVGRHEAFLPIQLSLESQGVGKGSRESLISSELISPTRTPCLRGQE